MPSDPRQPKVTVKLSDFNRVFVINVTLEQLGTVATHISSMSDLGIIKQKEWPWVVNLNDLRAISEIIEHPTEFIHYLTRRLQANDIVQLRLFNELDFFMLYIKEGLYWQLAELDRNTMFTAMGYTEELDAYYFYKEGIRSPVPKPKQPVPDGLNNLITALEKGQPMRLSHRLVGELSNTVWEGCASTEVGRSSCTGGLSAPREVVYSLSSMAPWAWAKALGRCAIA